MPPEHQLLPNAVYRAETCIRAAMEAAVAFRLPHDRIMFEVTEGEQVTNGTHLKSIFNEYRRQGLITAIDVWRRLRGPDRGRDRRAAGVGPHDDRDARPGRAGSGGGTPGHRDGAMGVGGRGERATVRTAAR